MLRRSFLSLLPAPLAASRQYKADIAIIGASTGGCAAALAALRNGLRVVLTEETAWIGGQITSQLVSAFDEHPWIEGAGCTRSYRDFRNAIRRHYRLYYPLSESARNRSNLSPGGGLVSNFQCDPRAALHVLEAMLAPYLASGRLTLLLKHKPTAVDTAADRIRAVTVTALETQIARTIEAAYFLDATELGDLLPLSNTEYVTGFESRAVTNEPSAPAQANPANEQAFTMCFAIDYLEGEDHTIEKPAQYAFWRDYVPELKPAWSGKLLGWSMSNPRTLAPRMLHFDPAESRRGPASAPLNLWLYRRIAARENFTAGSLASDISLINWPQNDYWLGRLIDVPEAGFRKHVDAAKQLSLSLLYWMQTEAPRPKGGYGWRGLRLRPDIAGTDDGLAMYPYIREARRIAAEFTVAEQHVGANARMQITGKRDAGLTAAVFPDSVGVGSYRIDLHPTSTGDNYLDISSLPFQIPLGALLPKRVENLLPACKNLGVTHITNGCYRLHPVEWNIGEAAALTVAHALATRQTPRQIRNNKKSMATLQEKLTEDGVEIAWRTPGPR
ncbi:MAG: FAD-dependent oxidoreductase [Bryobacterales bacterium]|nr:FAD-dependent oxidoreductase [Bryobacterales bacterium]